jgi:hypothetical protein
MIVRIGSSCTLTAVHLDALCHIRFFGVVIPSMVLL